MLWMPSGVSGMPCGRLCVLRCVGVLAGWSIVHFFIWDSTILFFPLKLGRDPTLTKLFFLDFSPPTANYDLKSLMHHLF